MIGNSLSAQDQPKNSCWLSWQRTGFLVENSINDLTVYKNKDATWSGIKSPYMVVHETRQMIICQNGEKIELPIYHTRILLRHEITKKIVYLTPWTLENHEKSIYKIDYDSQKKLVTIFWEDRVMAVLSENELDKESTQNLLDVEKEYKKIHKYNLDVDLRSFGDSGKCDKSSSENNIETQSSLTQG